MVRLYTTFFGGGGHDDAGCVFGRRQAKHLEDLAFLPLCGRQEAKECVSREALETPLRVHA